MLGYYVTLNLSSSCPMKDTGRRDSTIGFGNWLYLRPLSMLSSVLEDPLKTSVAMSSVVYLLVFFRFLEANSKLHYLQACFITSSIRDKLLSLCEFSLFLTSHACIPARFVISSFNTEEATVLEMRAVDFRVSHACGAVDNTMEEYRRNLIVLLME